MPRYYCDYCDTYLTHDSPSVRKQHNAGYKHKANVRSYYQQFEEQQTQSLIDQRIKEHLGQTAAYQVGAAYNQHVMAQRPRPPVLPTPVMQMPGGAQLNPALLPGMRPPVLPRPIPGPPGYVSAPGMPSMVAPPGAPPVPGQVNGLPRPPPVLNPIAVPGSAAPPPSSTGAPTMVTPSYQANSSVPTSGGFDGFNANAQANESNH
ncbi:U1 small nuclear ribonucleoprotein C-like [Pistacia vera]|uniref:U1 small nuclear ribonucleoprotein C n=1 Tax=Pistacia vera TaxID=55513 RepID=UPI001262B4BD|nr:U1 small nuclear ribonucleoprotein C [Pistacia vera]XP_031250954.1 U1 small nuclear ribonucleoprotein C-like [Pistacia vera]